MHMVIRAIVYAKDKDEALSQAESVFEQLTENQHPFDYYQMFNTEGTSVSGKGRWGEIPAASLVTSKAGKALVDEGMKYTLEHFERSMKCIRNAVNNHTDTELFEDKDVKCEDMTGMFKYFCHCAGEYEGANVWLYNEDGEGITSQHMLHDTLSKWKVLYEDRGKPNPYKDMKVWIVPADVHY